MGEKLHCSTSWDQFEKTTLARSWRVSSKDHCLVLAPHLGAQKNLRGIAVFEPTTLFMGSFLKFNACPLPTLWQGWQRQTKPPRAPGRIPHAGYSIICESSRGSEIPTSGAYTFSSRPLCNAESKNWSDRIATELNDNTHIRSILCHRARELSLLESN